MKENEIINYAANDVVPQGKLNMAEWLLFYGLRDLYRGYRGGLLTRAFAAKAKTQMLLEFRSNSVKLHEVDELGRHYAKMYRNIESAAADFTHDRTVENAEAFFRAVYGVGLKKPGEE